ncbi:PepSY-associated TM helix domain-containing protein [Achromobacter aegrifaciens]|uniref:PepSY-associated TM helix domain-containing protein n=1 Tax=Achromobacter aegrifaciens TaxID=1287736 RepID=UPI00278CE67C|nr:PepSY-associated TM helix domain-containing protein [Achromobacter aegrifaciens]MDQ1760652.1 PepSY-associated TM helix domain-containing protein [Achromobacter aegrifaciens]
MRGGMRGAMVLLHRWCGLFIAGFLFVAGLTGALIAWNHELDEWANPKLYVAASGATANALAPLELARRVEAADPRLRVSFVPLTLEPGHTAMLGVAARIDPATAAPYVLGFNQLAVDPATGQVQGQRQWGQISLSRENLLPFLYKLHYTLHIPKGWGIEFGVWLMGVVSAVWIIDSFLALCISFPNVRSWRKSLSFRLRQGGVKLNFDVHRSGGVWVWGLLLMLAVTSVSLNLGTQVMQPLVSVFSPITPSPFQSRQGSRERELTDPLLRREQAIAVAEAEGSRRGWTAPAGSLFYAQRFGIYGVTFYTPEDDRDENGMGNNVLYLDGDTGTIVGERVPGQGTWGDVFMQAQLPLHSGRLLGTPGRVLISFMGIFVATLSVTGLVIWVRKRRGKGARLQFRKGNSLPSP